MIPSGTKKLFGIRVQKARGEETRSILIQKDYFNSEYRILKDEDHLIIPLRASISMTDLKSLIHAANLEIKTVEAEFQEAKKQQSGGYQNFLPTISNELTEYLPTAFDVIGAICILKLNDKILSHRTEIARAIMKANSNIKGVFLDEGVSGELRVRRLTHLAGHSTTVTIYKEFGISLNVDVAKVYFSPRLAGERNRIVTLMEESTKEKEECHEHVLDMFAGVGPFAIAIAKRFSGCTVHAIDLNPSAVALLKENCIRNKVENVVPLNGDSRDIVKGLSKNMRFQRIIMNLPHDAIDFLDVAMEVVESGMIHLYSICPTQEIRSREHLIRTIVEKGDMKLLSIDSIPLKGYSPTETVFAHDLRIAPGLQDSD